MIDHSSQGVTTYRYNRANQRIYMKTGTKISYFLYGLGGERLLEMEEQCGGNCWNYQETQRWIYFAGRKMFSKTGTTLKAITPNRLETWKLGNWGRSPLFPFSKPLIPNGKRL